MAILSQSGTISEPDTLKCQENLRKIQEWADEEQKIEVNYADNSEKIIRLILEFSSSEHFVHDEINLPDPVVI